MARGKPSVVVSDGFPAYIKTFENEFFTLRNPITKHICNMGFRDKMNNNYLHYHLSLVTAISPPSERFISMKLHIKIAKK